MLLPQAPEDDVYDNNGNQVDDINSIVELIMVKLGIDHHADDEDNDQGQNFHLVKVFDYCFEPAFTKIKQGELILNNRALFGEYKEEKIPLMALDIIVPPPKSNT
jgi:hypothetical protein